ncbi:YafY family protein [Balneolales bacterium ANBcel1]|nr:YafY family protein [Balneolales bacterium ANBcel1]
MNSNERRLKILYQLQSGKNLSIRDLTEYFGISRRTVFRDLRVIQDLGVPIIHDPETGYGVMRDGMIPPIMFQFRELAVIVMGLSFVKAQVDREMVKDAENVLLKIKNAIPPSLQKQIDELEKRTLVSPYIKNIKDREKGGDWFVLCSSFIENRPVSFVYLNEQGVKKQRTVDPHILVYFSDHWNAIGYCHDRQTLRNFRLSRMSDIKLLESTIQKPFHDVTVDELLYGRFESSTTVVVSIAKEKVFQFLTELPGKIIDKQPDGDRIRISFSIDNLSYINEWLLKFGRHVQVVAPKALQTMRASLLEELLVSNK